MQSMKACLFAGGLVCAAGAALADSEMLPEALQLCLPGNSAISLTALTTAIEVGVVVTSIGAGPQYDEMRANNYYKDGAGGGWNAPLPGTFAMPQGGCVEIRAQSKPTPPDASGLWDCDLLSYSASGQQTVAIAGMPGTTIQTAMITAAGQATKAALIETVCRDVR